MVPPPSKNTVGVSKQNTHIILYYTSFRLVTLLKDIQAPMQVSDILGLTTSLKFIKFSFQSLLFFKSTSFPRKNKYCKKHIQKNSLFMSNFIMSVRRRKLKNAHSSRRKFTVQKKNPVGCRSSHSLNPFSGPFQILSAQSHFQHYRCVCTPKNTQSAFFTAKENNSTEHYGTHYECDTNLK